MEGRISEWEELWDFLSSAVASSNLSDGKRQNYAGNLAVISDFLMMNEEEFLEFVRWSREEAEPSPGGVPEEEMDEEPDVVVRVKMEVEEGGVAGSGTGAEGEAGDGHSLEKDSVSAAVKEEPEGEGMGAGVEGNGAAGPSSLLYNPAAGDGPGTPSGGDDDASLQENRKVLKAKKKKAPEPASASSLKQEDVMELTVEDIRCSYSRDCCLPIDVRKWEEIIKRCNSKTVIILPEGAFSFPPKYELKSLTPGLTISGKGPDKTTLCLQHGLKSSCPCPNCRSNSLYVAFSMTLENLTVKCLDTVQYAWPRLTLPEKKKNCVVRNVNFFNCSLKFASEFTLVEDCEFSSNLLDVSDSPLPGDLTGVGLMLFGGCRYGGSIIRNVSFRNLFFGILKFQSSEATGIKPDLIENVKCKNVTIGIQLVGSFFDTVKDVTYERDNFFPGFWRNPSAVVAIIGGDGNTVDGILCHGARAALYAFVVMRTGCGRHGSRIPRRNRIRNVKGAGGRYMDDGDGTEIFNVQG